MQKNLLQFMRDLPDNEARDEFAKRVGSTVGHLRNVGYGYKPCAHKLAALIWEHSGKAVSRESLCPSDYWVVWPELPAPKRSKRRATAEA